MTKESPQNYIECQLTSLNRMQILLGTIESIWQLRNRLKRFTKRRLSFAKNFLRSQAAIQPNNPVGNKSLALQTGEFVSIKTKEEIRATLGPWNNLKGCTFMEEMWNYCETTHRVLKRVERFLDERDYKVKKVQGLVILENVICQGTVDFGPCDRSCFFFWKEEWLKKLEERK